MHDQFFENIYVKIEIDFHSMKFKVGVKLHHRKKRFFAQLLTLPRQPDVLVVLQWWMQ